MFTLNTETTFWIWNYDATSAIESKSYCRRQTAFWRIQLSNDEFHKMEKILQDFKVEYGYLVMGRDLVDNPDVEDFLREITYVDDLFSIKIFV